MRQDNFFPYADSISMLLKQPLPYAVPLPELARTKALKKNDMDGLKNTDTSFLKIEEYDIDSVFALAKFDLEPHYRGYLVEMRGGNLSYDQGIYLYLFFQQKQVCRQIQLSNYFHGEGGYGGTECLIADYDGDGKGDFIIREYFIPESLIVEYGSYPIEEKFKVLLWNNGRWEEKQIEDNKRIKKEFNIPEIFY